MTFAIVLFIALTLVLAWMVLSSEESKEKRAKEDAQRRAEREEYYNQLAMKYRAGAENSYSSRTHIDFTDGEKLHPAVLESIKREITNQ